MNFFNHNIDQNVKTRNNFFLIILISQLLVAGISIVIYYPASINNSIDLSSIGLAPFSTGHLLGTDELGRDVGSQLLQGSQTTLLLSFLGIFSASFFGIFLGSISGYFGDGLLKVKVRSFLVVVVFTISILFLFSVHNFSGSFIFNFGFPLIISVGLGSIIYFVLQTKKRMLVGLDLIMHRIVEIYMTLPAIFIIILLTSIFRPSPFLFVLFCMLSMWPEFFLVARAEILKIKNVLFVDTARSIGQRDLNIIFLHLLPNISSPLLVLFSFGFARLMIIEATLSFLGIGLPPEYPGWGKMILSFHNYPEFWWLLVFPGLLIFINAISIQQIGRYFEFNKL